MLCNIRSETDLIIDNYGLGTSREDKRAPRGLPDLPHDESFAEFPQWGGNGQPRERGPSNDHPSRMLGYLPARLPWRRVVSLLRDEMFLYFRRRISQSGIGLKVLVACRSEFVTADAAGGIGVLPLDGPSVGGVGVDIAAKFAS